MDIVLVKDWPKCFSLSIWSNSLFNTEETHSGQKQRLNFSSHRFQYCSSTLRAWYFKLPGFPELCCSSLSSFINKWSSILWQSLGPLHDTPKQWNPREKMASSQASSLQQKSTHFSKFDAFPNLRKLKEFLFVVACWPVQDFDWTSTPYDQNKNNSLVK